jgi:hypothetical protein
VKVVVARRDGTSLVGEVLVTDAALGRHDRQESVALRVRLAGGRAEDTAALARLTGSRELGAPRLGRRRIGLALFGTDVLGAPRLFVGAVARALVPVPESHLAPMARRNVPGCKKVGRQVRVEDLLERRTQVPGHEATDALEFTEQVEGPSRRSMLHVVFAIKYIRIS